MGVNNLASRNASCAHRSIASEALEEIEEIVAAQLHLNAYASERVSFPCCFVDEKKDKTPRHWDQCFLTLRVLSTSEQRMRHDELFVYRERILLALTNPARAFSLHADLYFETPAVSREIATKSREKLDQR